MLELVKFIKSNPEWETILQQDPYNLMIKRDGRFILFKYGYIKSNFSIPLVQEARGIILDDEFNPVCVPFFKFGNYGESYVPDIDWTSAKVQEKIDGSLIKLWFDNGWHISTMGTIDANKASLGENQKYSSFSELFTEALSKELNRILEEYGSIPNLDPYNTYMFELVSPYNRVIINYGDIDMYHIGTRNNITLQELDLDIGFKKPKTYSFSTLEECIENANKLNHQKEGYVVVDKNFNRVKIKSPKYIQIHHLLNGPVTTERLVSIIQLGETDEFLNYFPEHKSKVETIGLGVQRTAEMIFDEIKYASNRHFISRKEFAEFAKSCTYPPLMFQWYDNKIDLDNTFDIKNWIMNNSIEKIIRICGLSDININSSEVI